MDSLEKAVAVEYAECASPKWTYLEPVSSLDVCPVLVNPIGFIDSARKN
jgi:hypothetical protein